jgi:hypothetical protein
MKSKKNQYNKNHQSKINNNKKNDDQIWIEKKTKGGWNRKTNSILKTISNETINNKKNEGWVWQMRKINKGGWDWKKINFINYFK